MTLPRICESGFKRLFENFPLWIFIKGTGAPPIILKSLYPIPFNRGVY